MNLPCNTYDSEKERSLKSAKSMLRKQYGEKIVVLSSLQLEVVKESRMLLLSVAEYL